jgi:hypothetical protein
MDALNDNDDFRERPHQTARQRREAKAIETIKAMRPKSGEMIFCSPSPEDEALRELVEAPEHIYFIYSAGRVKIGFSTNWRVRVDAVCQGCSHHAELVLVMPGTREMEQGYHALFAGSREGGEWFRLEGNMRRFLDRYASAYGRELLDLAHEDFLECSDLEIEP